MKCPQSMILLKMLTVQYKSQISNSSLQNICNDYLITRICKFFQMVQTHSKVSA